MADAPLLKYLRDGLAAGVSKDELSRALIEGESGWTKKEISDALKELQQEATPPPPAPSSPPPSPNKPLPQQPMLKQQQKTMTSVPPEVTNLQNSSVSNVAETPSVASGASPKPVPQPITINPSKAKLSTPPPDTPKTLPVTSESPSSHTTPAPPAQSAASVTPKPVPTPPKPVGPATTPPSVPPAPKVPSVPPAPTPQPPKPMTTPPSAAPKAKSGLLRNAFAPRRAQATPPPAPPAPRGNLAELSRSSAMKGPITQRQNFAKKNAVVKPKGKSILGSILGGFVKLIILGALFVVVFGYGYYSSEQEGFDPRQWEYSAELPFLENIPFVSEFFGQDDLSFDIEPIDIPEQQEPETPVELEPVPGVQLDESLWLAASYNSKIDEFPSFVFRYPNDLGTIVSADDTDIRKPDGDESFALFLNFSNGAQIFFRSLQGPPENATYNVFSLENHVDSLSEQAGYGDPYSLLVDKRDASGFRIIDADGIRGLYVVELSTSDSNTELFEIAVNEKNEDFFVELDSEGLSASDRFVQTIDFN